MSSSMQYSQLSEAHTAEPKPPTNCPSSAILQDPSGHHTNSVQPGRTAGISAPLKPEPIADPVLASVPPKVGETPRFWEEYDKAADKHDQDMVKGLGENVDVLLVFAGLFSGVNTAFIILSLSHLSPGPSDRTENLLLLLIQGVNNSTLTAEDISPPSFVPTKVAIRINCFFAASLACSLMAAFGAMLGKQWIGHYARTGQLGPLNMQGRHRHMKFTGVQRYHFRSVVQALPTLLQTALLFFFVGLIDFLWLLHSNVAYVVLVFASLGLMAYIFTVTAATRDPFCPFQTPVSTTFRRVTLSTCYFFSLVEWWLAGSKDSLLSHLLPAHDTIGPSPHDVSTPSKSWNPFRHSEASQLPRPTHDMSQSVWAWEDGSSVDAALASWILETSSRKEALLATAQNYAAMSRIGANDMVLQDAAFQRLVVLMKGSLKQLTISLDGFAGPLEADLVETVIIYGRAICHAMVRRSHQAEHQVRCEVAKQLADHWPEVHLNRARHLRPHLGELGVLRACLVGPGHPLDLLGIDPAILPLYVASINVIALLRDHQTDTFDLVAYSLSGPGIPSTRILGFALFYFTTLALVGHDKAENAWPDRWETYTRGTNVPVQILATLKAYPVRVDADFAIHGSALRGRSDQHPYLNLLEIICQLVPDGPTAPYHILLPPVLELLHALEGMLPAILSQLEHWGRSIIPWTRVGPMKRRDLGRLETLRRLQQKLLYSTVQLLKHSPANFRTAAEPLWRAASLGTDDSGVRLCIIQLMQHTPMGSWMDQGVDLDLFREYPEVSSFLCQALLHGDSKVREEALKLIRSRATWWLSHNNLDIHQQLIDARLIDGLIPHVGSPDGSYILTLLLDLPVWRGVMTGMNFGDSFWDAIHNTCCDASSHTAGRATTKRWHEDYSHIRHTHPELAESLGHWMFARLATKGAHERALVLDFHPFVVHPEGDVFQ